VTVALEAPPRVAVVAVKLAELAAVATVTEAGTVSRELVLARVMTAPPAGAAWDRVTTQVVEEFVVRVVGVHDKEGTEAGATKATVTLAALPT
jgi:acetolactate synthase small subunit